MITSTANNLVKKLRSLATDKRERRRERSFLLEGVRLVATALDAGASLNPVLYAPDQLDVTEGGRALLARLEALPTSYAASAQVVAAASETVSPQGVVAVTAWPDIELGTQGITLVLDGVQDPGNVGTLLRSAEAVGVAAVVCIRGTADVYSPKVVRGAMGAHFHVPLLADVSWDEAHEFFAHADHVYAADSEATMPYYAADWRQPSVLVIGNEANGISQEGLALATRQISIPMAGRSESLNAAVAGSVILFEALRQRSRGRT